MIIFEEKMMRSAARVSISTFSVIMAMAGIEHGIGEILQGSVAPPGMVFPSWPEAGFFRVVAGEPAMTILPNLLVTGILAVLFSLAYVIWALWFSERKRSVIILILLALAMLLFGGGLFPPVLAMLLALPGAHVGPLTAWFHDHLPQGLLRILKTAWLWSYAISILAWLCLCPGINILAHFYGIENPDLTLIVLVSALATLISTILCGLGYDAYRRIEPVSASTETR